MENSTLCWKIGTSFEDASYTILAWLNIISGILSVGSNLLVLTAIYSFPPLRKISSFLIASLAVADLLVGLLVNPIYTSIFIIKVFEDDQHPLRVTEHWLWLQTVITSTFTLTAVSIDRFIAVKKCLRYSEIVTVKRSCVCVSSIWFFSFLCASQRLVIRRVEDLPSLWICTTVLTVFLPFFAILYCYVHIFQAAQTQCVRIASESGINSRYCKEVLKNKKAAWTLCIVIGLFALLWLPSLALSLWHVSTADPSETRCIDYLWFWAAFLSFTSSFCNPWVYAIRTKQFRMGFLKVLRIRALR